RMAREITSENVVAILDAGTDAAIGVPFLVMDLLRGRDLSALLEGVGPLVPEAAVRVFVQACRGVAAAHARSIVHRDLKPANIFLDTSDSGVVSVKICDFGIAKIRATDALDNKTASLTKSGSVLGSPIYMSPEQVRNAKGVDARTDVWSLALSLYEA